MSKQIINIKSEIDFYHQQHADIDVDIFKLLAKTIATELPKAEGKVWHGHPVWFIDENPIVGYQVKKGVLHLLFWSGQNFEEEKLIPIGKFKAAEYLITSSKDIKMTALKKWLKMSKSIQWDYKNLIKRKGTLIRLK
jgi:hypothetical protein